VGPCHFTGTAVWHFAEGGLTYETTAVSRPILITAERRNGNHMSNILIMKKRPESIRDEAPLVAQAEQLSALATKLLALAKDLRLQVLEISKARIQAKTHISFPDKSVN
jgi:hypothetical protein